MAFISPMFKERQQLCSYQRDVTRCKSPFKMWSDQCLHASIKNATRWQILIRIHKISWYIKKKRSKRHNLHPPAVKISPIERTCENPFVPVKKSVIIVLEMKDPLISRRKQVKIFSLIFRTLYPSLAFSCIYEIPTDSIVYITCNYQFHLATETKAITKSGATNRC